MSRPNFAEQVSAGLADQNLHIALERIHASHKVRIRRGWPDEAERQALREQGRAIRAATIAGLDSHLDRFIASVMARGGKVFRAGDADAACNYIRDLAVARGARLAVKSKSMVTEEIHLNQRLEEAGVRAVETDLGEYIIQLAGERPSHILGPALHKTRHQVKALFEEIAGHPLPDDIKALCTFARERLRQEFLDAAIGISGCNFAVAESGSIVLFTNEGNGRMVTSLPPVHVVVMGMERIVPTWGELGVLVSLLARTVTGRKMNAYVSVITGPRGPGEDDGPEELHVVIVDNGRSRIRGTDLQEMLHCIRCGACLNVCPVYRQIGGHAYDSIYSGPMGAVLSPLLMGMEEYGHLPQASTLCGACSDVCPVQIPLHDLLVRLRAEEATAGRPGRRQRLAYALWRLTFSRPALYNLITRAAALLQGPWVRNGRIRSGPGPLRSWTRGRDFPPLARQRFRDRWAAAGGRFARPVRPEQTEGGAEA